MHALYFALETSTNANIYYQLACTLSIKALSEKSTSQICPIDDPDQ